MTDQEKLFKKRQAIAKKLKNPKVEELPSGKFRCQKMINGKRYNIIHEDPVVAHAEINAIAAGIVSAASADSTITFEHAYNNFVARNANIFSPATLAGYRRIKDNHLQDILPIRMCDLTQHIIQSKVNTLAKTKSAKTVKNIYGLITSVYYQEFPDRKLKINLPQKDAAEISIPSENELTLILEACAGTKYELPILLAMWLGLRASEIRGLTWDCIDGNRIHINKAIVDGDDGPALKKTKSSSGDRWLFMPERVKELIYQQPKVDEYILHFSGHAIYSGFSRICEKAGVQHYRLHDLRHVFASVSLSLNIPTEYIRRDMGHKTDNMIKQVYGHMMDESRAQYASQRDAYYCSISKLKDDSSD